MRPPTRGQLLIGISAVCFAIAIFMAGRLTGPTGVDNSVKAMLEQAHAMGDSLHEQLEQAKCARDAAILQADVFKHEAEDDRRKLDMERAYVARVRATVADSSSESLKRIILWKNKRR